MLFGMKKRQKYVPVSQGYRVNKGHILAFPDNDRYSSPQQNKQKCLEDFSNIRTLSYTHNNNNNNNDNKTHLLLGSWVFLDKSLGNHLAHDGKSKLPRVFSDSNFLLRTPTLSTATTILGYPPWRLLFRNGRLTFFSYVKKHSPMLIQVWTTIVCNFVATKI